MGKDITTDFPHPDPKQAAKKVKLKFCEYWWESWNFEGGNSSKVHGWLDEFKLLERKLNAPYNARLFNQKSKDDGSPEACIDQDMMSKLIQGKMTSSEYKNVNEFDQARVAVRRMRFVVGIFIYMQDPTVADIFAKEKKRKGKIIGHIGKELPNTPKKVGKDSYTAWQPQDLEKRWDEYMDDVFDKAKSTAVESMNLNIKLIKDEWDSNKKAKEFKSAANDSKAEKDQKKALEDMYKDMSSIIKKLEDEWEKVKNWRKPTGW
ncbi:hypothetical protein yc1106_02979 [Curvularia clavata]|uniref:Uncharacterized protein n=1 Tax=Curvularia clavata TaxID=95742 RepID=A0A9Q8Z4U7_CURCL|nr:hypothetical protein yc1106_02979 [Curvularia clavata]